MINFLEVKVTFLKTNLVNLQNNIINTSLQYLERYFSFETPSNTLTEFIFQYYVFYNLN